MVKLLCQKNAWQAVVETELEDLWNELTGFKKQVAGVFRKYDKNFRETAAAHSSLHQGWISHEAAITLINECCTCGGSDSEDEFVAMETVSSPSPIRTSMLLKPVPLQVVPTFQVGWVTQHLFVKPLTLPFQMQLLPEGVPLPSGPGASAVCGCQRAVPSSPFVRRCMAEKLAVR